MVKNRGSKRTLTPEFELDSNSAPASSAVIDAVSSATSSAPSSAAVGASTDQQGTSSEAGLSGLQLQDEFGELLRILPHLRPAVQFTASCCCLPIPGLEHFKFLKIEYADWHERCSSLSADWQTSWHGALTPYILNTVHENGFREPTVVGAANGWDLFHSKNLVYPIKYAYPSPLVLEAGAFSMASWPADEPLYCSMLELKVNPLVKCKGRKWHFTRARDISRCVHFGAVLYGVWQGDRTHKQLQIQHGFILMRNGVALDLYKLL